LTVPGLEVIPERRLREALSIDDALGAARRALQAYSEGRLRIVASVLDLDRGDVHVKGGHGVGSSFFVVKIASWVPPEGPEGALHGGGSLVCEAATGRPVALLLDQHYLSDLRTAAAGAVATDLLAREDSSVAGAVGTGVQGRLQLEAVAKVRPIATALVYGRRRQAAEELARNLRQSLAGVEVVVADSVDEVLAAADVVITATAATEPFVFAESLRPGQHLNAIGADDEGKAELAEDCFLRADGVWVDSIAQSGATAELGAAIAAGAFSTEGIVGELGGILAGGTRGRTDPAEITIAKMTGIGALDVTIAEVAMKACLPAGSPINR
jgi:ornithine cyclodeaminase/alanine dehydrogenase-like protein (mu-crystallin family)